MFEELAAMIHEKFPGIQCDVVTIKNDFFGDTVKVAGLLTAEDVVRQLKGKIHDAIMLPMSMFRSDRAITLDDVTVEALEKELGAKIFTVSNNGAEFLEKCLEVRPVE